MAGNAARQTSNGLTSEEGNQCQDDELGSHCGARVAGGREMMVELSVGSGRRGVGGCCFCGARVRFSRSEKLRVLRAG